MTLTPVRAVAAAVLLISSSLAAQDTTKGVRIGLTYTAGSKPGVVVLASKGVGADSVRAIVQRDLANGDRVEVIALEGATASNVPTAAPAWAVLARMGAAAAVQVTPTVTGLHLVVYDVAKQTTALVRDYAAPPMTRMREWRSVAHWLSDDSGRSTAMVMDSSRSPIRAFPRQVRGVLTARRSPTRPCCRHRWS
jgi:hypothetical protein